MASPRVMMREEDHSEEHAEDDPGHGAGGGGGGRGGGGDDHHDGNVKMRKAIRRQMTVQRIAKVLKEPRDAEINRKVKARLDSAKKWQQMGYLAVLFILVLILVVQIIQLVIKYIAAPTYVETEIVPQSEAIFPAMTVCPERQSFKAGVLKAHGFSNPLGYNDNDFTGVRSWSSNQSGVDEESLFRLATHCVEDLFDSVYIRFFRADASTGKYNIKYSELTDETRPDSFKEERHRPFGRCHTLYPEEWIRQLGVYYMKIKFVRSVKLYFHRPGQFLDLSGRMGHKMYPGEVVQAQVNYEDVRMVPKKTDRGKEMSCTNSTFDNCMNSALERLMLQESGCVVPWLKSEGPICTDAESANTTFWIHYNRVTNQMGDCPTPCESLMVTVGGKNYRQSERSEYGVLYLYFSPRVILSQEHFLYDFVTLMAEVGGYVGLLLGFSFAHFLKWFNLAFEQTLRTWELNKALKAAAEEEEREEEVDGKKRKQTREEDDERV